ncbi:adenine nucleotide translocase lysine N-methyltransferase isoform X2 [Polyodon spathula]|uniref:adenine nucleotide translocase lysine N-methyltransferase isoform X2 n=1 Tax=Polyodon spathula TaxID=7913 RepID=UPI001B7ED531|nr:adenine nucleotide translocase lysine N-methyltransferase isoform X2 [Polyodon spathula]
MRAFDVKPTQTLKSRAAVSAHLVQIRSPGKEMEQDSSEEAMTEFKEKPLGGWGLLQITAGTGLAVYTVWAGIIMPGFRRVPLKLQVPYVPASHAQVRSVMTLLQGRSGNIADLGSGDGRIVLEAYRQGFQPVVGYELNPWLIRLSNFHAWRAGYSGKVSFRQEDLWKVSLAECRNVTVFLAPSVVHLELAQLDLYGGIVVAMEDHSSTVLGWWNV